MISDSVFESALEEGREHYAQYNSDVIDVRAVFAAVRDVLIEADFDASVEEDPEKISLLIGEITLASMDLTIPVFPGVLAMPAVSSTDYIVHRIVDVQTTLAFLLRCPQIQALHDNDDD